MAGEKTFLKKKKIYFKEFFLVILSGFDGVCFALLKQHQIPSLPYFINDYGHVKGDGPLLLCKQRGIWWRHNQLYNVFIRV